MAEPKSRRRLDVLAYRCTPELLGGATVHVREFPEGVRSLWRLLERNYRDRMGREEIQAPHSVATNALRCLTGGYAYFNPERLFLVTHDPVDDDLLCDTFTLMSRLAAGDEIDDIDLGSPTPLAERIAGTPQQQRLLAEYLRRTEAGQPDAAPWVYRSATWDLSRRLTQGTWTVDGLDITLRPDSEGGFIAWDHPWSNRAGAAHALARCRMVMKTMPNIADPLILVSAAATRVKNGMAFARTVLAAQDDPARPIIEVEMAGRDHVRTISRLSLQTLARLGMDHSVLRGIQDRVDQERQAEQAAREQGPKHWYPPGGQLAPIRPIHSKNYKFPVGRGVGMHFLRGLDARFCDVFGDTATSPPIYFDTQGFKRLQRKDGLYADPADVARSLSTMGYNHLRLVCLWYKDENRLRMIHGLCDAYGLNPQLTDPADGVPVPLYQDGVSAVFHEVPKFLIHGPDAGSSAGIAQVSALRPEPGTLVGVWAETDYSSADEEISEASEQDASEARDRPGRLRDDEDAKPRARRTLARMGAVSQFIKGRDAGDKGEDHPVIMAQLDLNRSLGIIDRRIDNVMVDSIGTYPTTAIAHCGIFVRRQSKRRGETAAKICITAAVLKPPGGNGEAWTMHGWSYTCRQWQPYHQAQAAYHAQDYPVGKMTELVDDNQGHKKVARTIDQALGDLARYLNGMPYTVTVDGLATRRLWKASTTTSKARPETRHNMAARSYPATR
jgi:pPIWI_RE module N-terminal domain/RNaseH domain of pPIWI_RE/MID domain of pPIWI_RE